MVPSCHPSPECDARLSRELGGICEPLAGDSVAKEFKGKGRDVLERARLPYLVSCKIVRIVYICISLLLIVHYWMYLLVFVFDVILYCICFTDPPETEPQSQI